MHIHVPFVIIFCVFSNIHEIFGQICDRGYADSGGICDECGISMSQPNTHIFGKEKAVDHSWPSNALIILKLSAKTNKGRDSISFLKYICSGTIINRQTVLTAASCVDYNYKNLTQELNVYLGLNSIEFLHEEAKLPDYAKKVAIEDIKIHESYNPKQYEHDIALLILSEPIEFNDYIRPACLPYWENKYPFKEYKISAVGIDTDDTFLNNLHLTVDKFCFNSSEFKFCAGTLTEEFSKKKCSEDIGGGVYTPETQLIRGKQRFILSGLNSNTTRCGKAFRAYTRTAKYLRWIKHNWKLFNNATQTADQQNENGANIKIIVGAVIGSVAFLVFVVIVIVVMIRRKRPRNELIRRGEEQTNQINVNRNNTTAKEIITKSNTNSEAEVFPTGRGDTDGSG